MESLKLNIEKKYGKVADRWGLKNDRRKYFSNKYYQIMQAIDDLIGMENSYIICAVLEQIDQDIREMDEIFKSYTAIEEDLEELKAVYQDKMEG